MIFDAELLNARGVRARVAVLERQHLTALHDAIQRAFGWWDDHLYSFCSMAASSAAWRSS